MKVFHEHTSSFNEVTGGWLEALHSSVEHVDKVSKKFEVQLRMLLERDMLPEDNDTAQGRIKSAVEHFTKELDNIIQTIPQSPAITDSRMVAMSYNSELRALFHALSLKNILLKSCSNGFSTEGLNKAKKAFTTGSVSLNAYAGTQDAKTESAHPELYRLLRQLRDTICAEKEVPIYMVCGSAALEEMSTYLPLTLSQLVQITGFGKVKAHQYGDRFLRIINKYVDDHGLSSAMPEKKAKKQRKEKEKPAAAKPKKDTRQETFDLYKQGKSVKEIADERSLTVQTVEGHLAHFIVQGNAIGR